MKPKTPAERKAAERARKRADGLMHYCFWLTPKERAFVQLYIAQMRTDRYPARIQVTPPTLADRGQG